MREGVEGQLELSPSLLTVCGGWHGGTAWALGAGLLMPMTVSFTAGLWAASTLSGGAVPAAQVALCRLPLLPEISRSLGRAEHWLPRRPSVGMTGKGSCHLPIFKVLFLLW